MSRCILAARAANKRIIDGVHLDISDEEGLIKSCIQGRNLGFDGKSLIHPSQIMSTNQYFSPSEEEIIHARKVIVSYDEAIASGKAVCVVDNKLVEKVPSALCNFQFTIIIVIYLIVYISSSKLFSNTTGTLYSFPLLAARGPSMEAIIRVRGNYKAPIGSNQINP